MQFMKFIKEFKEFAIKGNMIDLAVGVVIGTAFNKIIASLVADLIMPAIGLLTGGISLKDRHFTFDSIYGNVPITLNYGMFLQNIVEFLIIALSVFITIELLVRLHLRKQAETPPPPEPTKEEKLLTEIRDILKQQKTF
jgi:large conductance mechanosensitive channel